MRKTSIALLAILCFPIFFCFASAPTNTKAAVDGVATTWIQSPIAALPFTTNDTSMYEWANFLPFNGSLKFEDSITHDGTGSSLNITTTDNTFSYFQWRFRYAETKSIWFQYGIHTKFWVYIKDNGENPNTLPIIKWYYNLSEALYPQFWCDASKGTINIKNSTDETASSSTLTLEEWHWIDINFDFQNDTIRLYMDTYDEPKATLPETGQWDIYEIHMFGDDWVSGSAGTVFIQDLKILGDAPVVNSGKPTYYTQVLPIKNKNNIGLQNIAAANKTTNLRFTILLENDSSRNGHMNALGDSTIIDACKNFLQYHPDSVVGLWVSLSGETNMSYYRGQMESFKVIFGYYPQVVGSYTMSSEVIDALYAPPYNVKAFMCHTEDANAFCQFENYPMFLSDNTTGTPSIVGKRNAIAFQWASTSPFWYWGYYDYESNWRTTTFLTQSDYFYSSDGKDCKGDTSGHVGFQWLTHEINNTQYNDFGYITNGVESDADWGIMNSTRVSYYVNWTLQAWDSVCANYPTLIQPKTLVDVANIMLSSYTETPLYVLKYPWWHDCTVKRNIWIVEGSAYQAWFFQNATYFGMIRLMVYGNTTSYPYWNRSSNHIFYYPYESYPEIIRSTMSTGEPMHGIDIAGFYPTSLNVVVNRSAQFPYATFVSVNPDLQWTTYFVSGNEQHYIQFDIKALVAQSPTVSFEFTATRNETKWILPFVFDWNATFRVSGSVYNYGTLTANSGYDVSAGFNCSEVFIRTNPSSKVATIHRFQDSSGTSTVTFAYDYKLAANETTQIMLILGLDVREVITEFSPFPNVTLILALSTAAVIAACGIAFVYRKWNKSKTRIMNKDSC